MSCAGWVAPSCSLAQGALGVCVTSHTRLWFVGSAVSLRRCARRDRPASISVVRTPNRCSFRGCSDIQFPGRRWPGRFRLSVETKASAAAPPYISATPVCEGVAHRGRSSRQERPAGAHKDPRTATETACVTEASDLPKVERSRRPTPLRNEGSVARSAITPGAADHREETSASAESFPRE